MTPVFFIVKKNTKNCFHTVNLELEKVSQWFKDNKLSIITLFYKNSFKDEISITIPVSMIGNNLIERQSSINFLEVLCNYVYLGWLFQNRWKQNSENIGQLYRVSQFLNENSLKTVYLTHIQSYLNYEILHR